MYIYVEDVDRDSRFFNVCIQKSVFGGADASPCCICAPAEHKPRVSISLTRQGGMEIRGGMLQLSTREQSRLSLGPPATYIDSPETHGKSPFFFLQSSRPLSISSFSAEEEGGPTGNSRGYASLLGALLVGLDAVAAAVSAHAAQQLLRFFCCAE